MHIELLHHTHSSSWKHLHSRLPFIPASSMVSPSYVETPPASSPTSSASACVSLQPSVSTAVYSPPLFLSFPPRVFRRHCYSFSSVVFFDPSSLITFIDTQRVSFRSLGPVLLPWSTISVVNRINITLSTNTRQV